MKKKMKVKPKQITANTAPMGVKSPSAKQGAIGGMLTSTPQMANPQMASAAQKANPQMAANMSQQIEVMEQKAQQVNPARSLEGDVTLGPTEVTEEVPGKKIKITRRSTKGK